jgi:rare lipoprotein A (peptidoglycan hydrolase)
VTGQATWYSESPAGGCASPTLPRGTEVRVVNDANGATTTCLVDDREADNPGRVLDMSYTGFSEIGDPSQGVITVTISW